MAVHCTTRYASACSVLLACWKTWRLLGEHVVAHRKIKYRSAENHEPFCNSCILLNAAITSEDVTSLEHIGCVRGARYRAMKR